MSKYNILWEYIQKSGDSPLKLSLDEIKDIVGFEIDPSFFNHIKELSQYGYTIGRFISPGTIMFKKIDGKVVEKITLKKVENEYKKWIEKNVSDGRFSNIDEMINASLTLFQEIKVKGLAADYEDGDMLLFQYGTYDWGKGAFFNFDITRQFIKRNEDEPYQMSMTLFFEPIECESYNCWSNEFDDLEQWRESIKGTEGYKRARELTSKRFEMIFEQC